MVEINLSAICKDYDVNGRKVRAIDNVNLTVPKGEIFGVIGPSGAGKSSLIRCVNLLEIPTSGSVIIGGRELTTLKAAELREQRQRMGMIFQHFNLLSSRDVFENIALPLELLGAKKAAITKKVAELLELTELTERAHAYPSQLSGGQKQRVAIARALTTEPDVLLCDEATSALDPQTTHAILQLLSNINSELGVTMMLITHEMSVVKEICHQLAIMERGQVVEQGRVLDFFANPKTDLAKQFIRSSVKEKFPENIAKRFSTDATDNTIPVLRLSFVGHAAEEPLIAHLMQTLKINLNILLADIETISKQMIGTMVLEADAPEKQLNQGIEFLTNKGVNVEVIGHVQRLD